MLLLCFSNRSDDTLSNIVLKCVHFFRIYNDWSCICIISVDCDVIHWKLFAADVLSVLGLSLFCEVLISLRMATRTKHLTAIIVHNYSITCALHCLLSMWCKWAKRSQCKSILGHWMNLLAFITRHWCINPSPLSVFAFAKRHEWLECHCQLNLPRHTYNRTHKHCWTSIQTLVAAKWMV